MYSREKINNGLIILLISIVCYFIAFEYIIPANKIFPKLSLVFESIFELFKHYNLFSGIAITSSVIYISLSVILLIVVFLKEFNSYFLKLNSFIKVPFFLIILVFAFWFGNVIWAEFVFAIIVIVAHISYKGKVENVKINNLIEFVELNKLSTKLPTKIKSVFTTRSIIEEMRKTHFYLWTFILIYEFINNTGGIGTILERVYNNYDLAGLFAISLILYVLIYIGDKCYILIKNKLNT
ncbi:MAG TPA: hypothetical protein PL041_12575 [Melioribacteraceae bacterium]|nr:hypothetical protein [Melioribacteraceae bacterium]